MSQQVLGRVYLFAVSEWGPMSLWVLWFQNIFLSLRCPRCQDHRVKPLLVGIQAGLHFANYFFPLLLELSCFCRNCLIKVSRNTECEEPTKKKFVWDDSVNWKYRLRRGYRGACQMGTPALRWYRLREPPFQRPRVQLMDICHSPTTADPASVRGVNEICMKQGCSALGLAVLINDSIQRHTLCRLHLLHRIFSCSQFYAFGFHRQSYIKKNGAKQKLCLKI